MIIVKVKYKSAKYFCPPNPEIAARLGRTPNDDGFKPLGKIQLPLSLALSRKGRED